MEKRVLIAVKDLFFAARIRETAEGLGVAPHFVKTADEMLDLAQRQQPALIIFDLNEASLRPLETIARLKADPDSAVIRTIGYYSHIQTELRRQAGEAGFDQVLAKSAFTQLLPTLLQGDP